MITTVRVIHANSGITDKPLGGTAITLCIRILKVVIKRVAGYFKTRKFMSISPQDTVFRCFCLPPSLSRSLSLSLPFLSRHVFLCLVPFRYGGFHKWGYPYFRKPPYSAEVLPRPPEQTNIHRSDPSPKTAECDFASPKGSMKIALNMNDR